MRRLFSTFAGGVPGVGLLVLRFVAGGASIADAVNAMDGSISSMLPHLLGALAGFLLLLGLWTPSAGTVLAASELWIVSAQGADLRSSIFLVSMGAALVMIGPGAWSLDAYLYGWKRIEIPMRRD